VKPAVTPRSPRRVTVRAQLRDLAVATVLALVVFTGGFAAYRTDALIARQLDTAQRALAAVGATPPSRSPLVEVVVAGVFDAAPPAPIVPAVLPGTSVFWVSPAVPGRYPFLPRRTIREVGPDGAVSAPRPLGGASAPARDKLVADAARELEAISGAPAHLGAAELARIVDDGSGRALAATTDRGALVRVVPSGAAATVPDGGTWVAITAPAAPEPYPWLVVIGLLGLGIAIAAAGAMVGGPFRGPALFLAAGGLAIPALAWNQPAVAGTIVAVAGVIAWAAGRGTTDRIAAGFVRHRIALGFLAPTALAMVVLVATPFVIGLAIGFYDHHHGQWTYVGLDNFAEILSGGGHPLGDPLNFWFVLGVTVLWTFANVCLHVALGVALALLLSRTWLRGKGVWRMLLILPWAIPNYITALIWKGMFEGEHGAINSLLAGLGLDTVSWFSSWATAFSANVITNTWLGFPFMMVVAIGAIQSIPRELYEAAAVDGATGWQRFREITLPHLRPAMAPAIALGSIWTFNMFNVIFLVSGGEPGGATNILVTDAYRWAFERGERYGMAAAYATIIFLVLLLWTVFGARVVKKEADAP
jgi:ABC-type sugar transport system permease subunit